MDIFNKKQKETADQSDRTEKSVHTLDDAFRAISPSTLSAVAGITALIGAVKSLVSVGSNIINVTSQFEQTQKSLETVLQSAEKGQKLFEDLRKFSFDTTFGVDELASASSQLLNAGEAVEKLQGDLKMLGDLAQGDKNKFAELTSIFAKIQNTGKATSMQLNQLALRGIPIQKTLKDMGVTGVASAEDLTRAFKQLTDEGGQFHDAMNNIIDTIEGKRGFITDTIKEINVNLGQLTGLTDAYKSTLDTVYNVLNTVNEKLMEWNENPVMKAIMSGVLTTVMTALVVVIGVSLASALKTVAVQLGVIAGLKALISPVGAIAGLTALVAGLAVGAKAYKKSVMEAQQETEKLKKAVEDAKKAMGNSYYLQSVGVDPNSTATKKKENTSKTIQAYKDSIAGYSKSLEEAKAKLEVLQAKQELSTSDTDKFGRQIQKVTAEINEWQSKIDLTNKFIDEENKKLEVWEHTVQSLSVDKLAESFEEIYNGTISQEEKDIENLRGQLQTVLAYKEKLIKLNGQQDENGNLIDYNKSKRAIDDTVRYLENKLKGVSAWEDVFKNVTGITVGGGANGKTKGQIAGEDYKARMDKLYNAQVKAQVAIGGKKEDVTKSVALDFVKTIEKQIEELISNIDVDLPFEETDATIQALNEELLKYKQIVGEVTDKTQTFGESIGNKVKDNFLSSSQDASNAVEGFKNGGIWGAIIGVVVGALMEVAKECDNFDRAMNPITTAFKKLKPLLTVFLDIGADVTTGIEQILGILQPVIKILGWFARILRVVGTVVNLVLNGLSRLVNAIVQMLSWIGIDFDGASKAMDDWMSQMNDVIGVEDEKAEAEKNQLEALRKQQEAYQSLLNAMKENEEWYIRQKTALNANTRKEGYQSVNDMILTPQGQFSTHPDDYIIATKNPSSLGGAVVNVNVQNNASSDVEITATSSTNSLGVQEILIAVSKKIADDVSNGANGWDVALARQQVRMNGRNMML